MPHRLIHSLDPRGGPTVEKRSKRGNGFLRPKALNQPPSPWPRQRAIQTDSHQPKVALAKTPAQTPRAVIFHAAFGRLCGALEEVLVCALIRRLQLLPAQSRRYVLILDSFVSIGQHLRERAISSVGRSVALLFSWRQSARFWSYSFEFHWCDSPSPNNKQRSLTNTKDGHGVPQINYSARGPPSEANL